MNRIVHFEFHAPDAEKAMAFYSEVFGWQFSKWDGPQPYWLIKTGEGEPGIDGGLMTSMDGQPRTVNTLAVDSVDAATERVTQAGGQVVLPKMAIPGVGWLAYCTDPGGLIFGVHETDPEAK